MLSTPCILIAHPTSLPSLPPSPAVADFVCANVLPAFQMGCGMEQGAATGIAVPPQPGSFSSDGLQPGSFSSSIFSLLSLLRMGCGQVTAAFREDGKMEKV